MDELKACPFCGAELDKHGCLTRNGVVTDYYIHPAPDEVRDDECPLCGCVFRAATWNRRPLEDALQAEIERLRDIVKLWHDKFERTKILYLIERAARVTVEERIASLRSQFDVWRELNPDNDDNEGADNENNR